MDRISVFSSLDSKPLLLWSEPAPENYRYPWIPYRPLTLPTTEKAEEARSIAEEIKRHGKQSFGKDKRMDALWKYDHALLLCYSYPSLKDEAAAIHSDVAEVCLRVGDSLDKDLPNSSLRLQLFWYKFSLQHICKAFTLLDPQSKFLYKVFCQRKDTLKRLVGLFNKNNTREEAEEITMFLFPSPETNHIHAIVQEFKKCFQSQHIPDTNLFCEALIFAVDNGAKKFLPSLNDRHIECGFPSRLLSQMISHENSRAEHLLYLLNEIKMIPNSYSKLIFDAHNLFVHQLLKKDISHLEVYEKLIICGMQVKAEDVFYAVQECSKLNNISHILKLLVQKCPYGLSDKDLHNKTIDTAKKKSKQLLEVLKYPTKVIFDLLIKEAHKCIQETRYSEAVSFYHQAREYCYRYDDLKDQRVYVSSQSAIACLKLHMYRDAYVHCMDWLKGEPNCHEAYFYRAKSLKGLLSSAHDDLIQKTYKDVIKDYIECHSRHPHYDAYYDAVIVAHEHNLTEMIPKLKQSDVKSGLSTWLLKKVVGQQDVTEALLKFIVFKLPSTKLKLTKPYRATSIDTTRVISRTADFKLMQRLIEFEMKVNGSHIITAVLYIPPENFSTFELLLECALNIGVNETTLTDACCKAIVTLKVEFVCLLISKGAKPPFHELFSIKTYSDNPIIQDYFKSEPTQKHIKKRQENNMPLSELKKCKVKIQLLHSEAHRCSSDGLRGNIRALQKFFEALELCKNKADLTKEAAFIHGRCAHHLLQARSYILAYRHADTSIRLSPSCEDGMVYIWRAESLKRLLSSDERLVISADQSLNFKNVISDYCKAHDMRTNIKAIVEALLLAINNDLSSLMTHIQEMPLDTCNNVLTEIMSRPECKDAHLEFLFNKMWIEKRIDVSKCTLEQLIIDIAITSSALLQQCLELGLPVSKEDIEMAIMSLKPSQIHLFPFIAARSNPEDIHELCQVAVNADRTPFVLTFIRLGSKLPVGGSQLLLKALEHEEYDTALALARIFTKETMKEIDLSCLVHPNIVNCIELIKVLIQNGVCPNGRNQKHPIGMVMNEATIPLSRKIELVLILLENGANCSHLCETGKGSTPLHKATEIALKAGDVRIIKSVCSSSTFNCNNTANDKGETPLHLAVCHRKEHRVPVLSALLEIGVLNPMKRDHSGKRPIDYCINQADGCYIVLKDVMEQFEPNSSQQILKDHKKERVDENHGSSKHQKRNTGNNGIPSVQKASNSFETVQQVKVEEKRHVEYKDFTTSKKIEFQFERIMNEKDVYFQEDLSQKLTFEKKSSSTRRLECRTIENAKTTANGCASSQKEIATKLHGATQSLAPCDSSNMILTQYGLDFDKLPWEVEVTSNVVKFMKNAKKSTPTDQWEAVHTIHKLAEGRRNKRFSKKVSSETSLQLYEARMTKGARILWEKAVSYSSKLTGTSKVPVYTQVIRVWEVVLEHDDLSKRIKYCCEQIKKSYKRGCQASIRLPLQAVNVNMKEGSTEVPMTLCVRDTLKMDSDICFIPAASTKDSEYNVTCFHAFDTLSANSMLFGTNDRRDFPFKEWQKEHEIIKLTSKEPILLLGRSGTGKTTCCLYRLWNEFKNFWNPDTRYKISHRMPNDDVSQDFHSSQENIGDEDNTSEQVSGDNIIVETNENFENCPIPSSGAMVSENSSGKYLNSGEVNLHQVFVTKNFVLCDQMKKHFYDMAAAYEFLDEQMQFENTNFVNNLSTASDYAFPLFLTARQFYYILDKSLSGKTFFKWNEMGELQIDIKSLDYYQEETEILSDLEQSNSEEELLFAENSPATTEIATSQRQTEQWVEVTALYFKEKIWPKISRQCGISSKDFDPLLVWMEIQSFIKGSTVALTKGDHLELKEYEEIGNRMAPNYASYRETVYKVFVEYQKYRQHRRCHETLFDECDLVINLFNRLKEVKHLPWTIHSFYIDEVQDFTQAELTMLIHCCCNPNSMFFTGDTAQSIMRGIAFRFQDLRSSFHKINSKTPGVKVPKKPYNLTVNFRSHSGILKLAGSILDLIKEYFKDSIDHLPDDEGMFPGPTPVLLESCNIKDLSLLLRTNKREASAIEFGAHQVILVQSQQARECLPSILKGCIVLTISEAKGLEFDDVLLYNFFSDSMVDEKGWRVMTSYLELYHEKVINHSKLPGTLEEPRSCKFDTKTCKSLNSELKYLYTAITRAKCNLWIYDTNTKSRLPMFDYWHKRDLVKVVQSKSSPESEDAYTLVFASNSTPEQWKAQGDNFKKRRLWEQAILCYEHAGAENQHLAKLVHAIHQFQQAQDRKPQLFVEAAVSFLECDELHHSIYYLRYAAYTLGRSKYHKLKAAKLYHRLSSLEKAAQLYKKAGDSKSYLKLEEKRKQYNFIEMIKLCKNTEEYEDAYKALVNKRMFKDAYRLALAQGDKCVSPQVNETWLQRGLKLAEEHNDESMKAAFVFQMAKVTYKQSLAGNEIKDECVELLDNLNILLKSKEEPIKAQAYLLLGILKKDATHCHTAWQIYHNCVNQKVGELEAFNQALQFGNYSESDHVIINMCHVAKETSNTLMKASSISHVIKEGLRFYGLQKFGVYYYAPLDQDIWFGESLMTCVCDGNRRDLDGMIRLHAFNVRKEVAKHCYNFISKWLSQCQLKPKLESKLSSFPLHEYLFQHHKLPSKFEMSAVKLDLAEYLQSFIMLLELQSLSDSDENNECSLAAAISIFTPDIYFYLCDGLKESHISTVRKSVISDSQFQCYVQRCLTSCDFGEKVDIDSLLMAWRVSCVSESSTKSLLRKLQDLEKSVNSKDNGGDQECKSPPGFIYWENEKKFYHIASIWLKSCVEIREGRCFLHASKLAIERFIGTISRNAHDYCFDVINVVDILAIHCTGILALLTHVRAMENYPTPCTVPLFYKSNVNTFNSMNCWKKEDRHLLLACADDVIRSKSTVNVFNEGCQLLVQSLDFLLGTTSYSSILAMGLKTMPSSAASKQSLILVFVLLGNLSMLGVFHVVTFFQKLQSLLNEFNRDDVPRYVTIAKKAIRSPDFLNPPQVFTLVTELLQDAEVEPKLARLEFRNEGLQGVVDIIPFVNEKQEQAWQESESDVHERNDMSMSRDTGEKMQLLSQLDPDVVDPEIVTYTFCNACGVQLKDDCHFMSSDDDVEQTGLDTSEHYTAHVCSDIHCSNTLLCKQFVTEISPLDVPHYTLPTSTDFHSETVQYHHLRLHLSNLLKDFEELKRQHNSSSLDRPISDIEEELAKNDKLVSELEEKCNWKKAVEEVSRMKESMDRVLKQYKDLYSEICAGFRQMQQQGDGNYTEETDDLDIQDDKREDLEQFERLISEGFDEGLRGQVHLKARKNSIPDKVRKKKLLEAKSGNNS